MAIVVGYKFCMSQIYDFRNLSNDDSIAHYLLINFVPFKHKKEEGRSMMDKRKLDGAVDETSAD